MSGLLNETIPLWLFVLLNVICIGICIEWRRSENKHLKRIKELESQ